MKTKLLTIITLCFCLAAVAPAQELITKSAPVKRAEQTSRDVVETISFLESRLNSFYMAATVAGEEQAYLDALGAKAVQALAWYKATRELVLTVKPTATVPPIVDSVFVANADGTVKFIAPPKPPMVVTPPPVDPPAPQP